MPSFLSHAQNFEDVMLWRALKHVEKGRYVDVGAQDPEVDSVSKLFFDRGWNGVHVEPSSHYANLLRAARPSELVMQVAVGAQSTVSKFFEFADTGLSTSDPEIAKEHVKAGFSCNEIAVPYVRLDEVFAQAGDQEIHWLKIDVEGGELDVIKGWRSEKVRPWVVLIESTRPLTQIQSHAKWERLLLKKGYQFVYFDGLNRFYISNSHPELAEFFSSGPNLFDDFSLTRRARPWCEYVDSQLSVIEADLEASQQAAKALFAEREAEWSRLLSAERERREQLRTENEVALKQAHEKLILAQDMAASASQAQARIENGYAESLAKGDLVPRRDLDNLAKRADQLSAQLDSVRLVSESERADLNAKLLAVHQQLAARDAELTSLRESAEQERRHHAQQLEIRNELLERERENVLRLDAQLCTLKAEMSQRDADLLGMHSKIASLDAELLAKRAASEQERQLQEQLLRATSALLQREKESAAQLDSVRNVLQVELDAANAQLTVLSAQLAGRDASLSEAARTHAMELSLVQDRLREAETLLRERDLALRVETERQGVTVRLLEDELQELRGEQHLAQANFEQRLASLLRDQQDELEELRSQLSSEKVIELERMSHAFAEREKLLREELTTLREENQMRVHHLATAARQMLSALQDRQLTLRAEIARLEEDGRNRVQSSFGESSVHIGELLAGDDAQFIEGVFLRLLGRSVDSSGAEFYLGQLRLGVSREQVVSEVRLSEEGQRASLRVEGLKDLALRMVGPVKTVGELLELDDTLFLSCAYQSILGRFPDPDGLDSYLARLEAGVSKLQILSELSESAEANGNPQRVAGLENSIRMLKLVSFPILGPLLRLFIKCEGNSHYEMRLRACEFHARAVTADYLDWHFQQARSSKARLSEVDLTIHVIDHLLSSAGVIRAGGAEALNTSRLVRNDSERSSLSSSMALDSIARETEHIFTQILSALAASRKHTNDE